MLVTIFSMTILLANEVAKSIASSNSSTSAALLIPTLEPR
jgi:hypothetical protein